MRAFLLLVAVTLCFEVVSAAVVLSWHGIHKLEDPPPLLYSLRQLENTSSEVGDSDPSVIETTVELSPSPSLTPSPLPPELSEEEQNKTKQNFVPGDVVAITANGTQSGSGAATKNTASVSNATSDTVGGGVGDGEGGAPPEEVVEGAPVVKPVLIGPPMLPSNDTRCGSGTLARRQCREIDVLLSGAIRDGSIAFNAREEDFPKEELSTLLDEQSWDILGSSISVSYCSLKSQHGRRSLVKQLTYNLQIVVDPVANPDGRISWQPVGLQAGSEPGPGKDGEPLPLFGMCLQPDGNSGFGTSRLGLNFSVLDGYESSRTASSGFRALTNQSTAPEESIQKLLSLACERLRTTAERTTCLVEPSALMTSVTAVGGDAAVLPERSDVLLLGYQRSLLAESSIAIVIAGLFLKDAAEAAQDTPSTPVGKFLQFHILFALFVAIVSQSFFSLWDLFSRVQNLRRGYLSMSLNRAWVLTNGLYALDIGGRVVALESTVPAISRMIVVPVRLNVPDFFLFSSFFNTITRDRQLTLSRFRSFSTLTISPPPLVLFVACNGKMALYSLYLIIVYYLLSGRIFAQWAKSFVKVAIACFYASKNRRRQAKTPPT